jgi:hypothetical protein
MVLLAGLQTADAKLGEKKNRIRVSPRMGYFIDADVLYGVEPVFTSGNTTFDGDPWNYDDGYFYLGSNGGAGGGSWYWGMEDNAQVVGNTIELSRTTYNANSSGDDEMHSSSPFPGIEVFYSHNILEEKGWFHGFEIGGSYQHLRFTHRGSYTAQGSQQTDAYTFYDPATDPALVPDAYKGTFAGPGFVLNTTPATSFSPVPNAQFTASSELDGGLWGLHLGPYVDIPLGERFFIHAAGGLTLALLDVDFSWENPGLAESSGKEQDYECLGGVYLGGEINWYATEVWILSTGLKFEYLKSYEEELGGNEVNLDLNHTLYWTFGVERDF